MRDTSTVAGLNIGYARVSTEGQDLTAQRNALAALGVAEERIYVDHGLTGTNRARPGLREALAACRAGDTLVVTKLDRLARSLPDARDIVDELTTREVKLNLGGSVHDPTDPVGRLLFNVLAMVAEFESDLIRMRTREGMAVARAAGKLRGRKPKLSPRQEDTSSNSTAPARRTPPTWQSCSELAARRSTGRSSEPAAARPSERIYFAPADTDPSTGPTRAGARAQRRALVSRRAHPRARRRPDAEHRRPTHPARRGRGGRGGVGEGL